MRDKRLPKVTAYVLVWTLLFSTLAFGQSATRPRIAAPAKSSETVRDFSAYLTEVPGAPSETYAREAWAISRILASNTKHAVLIDDQGYAREAVLGAVASRLASDAKGRVLGGGGR